MPDHHSIASAEILKEDPGIKTHHLQAFSIPELKNKPELTKSKVLNNNKLYEKVGQRRSPQPVDDDHTKGKRSAV